MIQIPTSIRRRAPLLAAALALLALLLAALALPAAAAAKKGKISGKLTEPGYTVIALTADGEAKTKRAPKGTFKLKPPAKKVTLHLRARDGTYGGPVVVGKRKGGKRAILGVEAKMKKVKLGKIKVRFAEGYAKAKLRKKVRKRVLDKKREALAKNGVPIGAGNIGLVRIKKPKDAPGDLDRDGVADPLDVDDDGDLVLDSVDPKPRKGTKAGSASEAQGAQVGDPFHIDAVTSRSAGFVEPIVNANASGIDDADIEAALQSEGLLAIAPGFPPPEGASEYASGELDCGELTYCSAGGTGEYSATDGYADPSVFDPEPWPDCCDPDGNGLGAFDLWSSGQLALLMRPNATSDQIRGEDVLIARVEALFNGEPPRQFELTATLAEVFATTPAIASYTDELGVTREVPYPYDGADDPSLLVADGPDADTDVEVTLNFWRPQRVALPDEAPSGGTKWVDVGGLQYNTDDKSENGGGGGPCPASSLAESDPNLSLGSGIDPGGAPVPLLVDSALSQPASPANTFTFTLNLSDCLAANGNSFNPGETAVIGFGASATSTEPGPTNSASSGFLFNRVP